MKKRIFIVEDNEMHRLLLQEILECNGFDVLSVPDGIDFLGQVQEYQPNLILLDLKLPEVDGFQLLELIQQSEFNQIPVVVISAFAFEQEKSRARRLGVCCYVTKPAMPHTIVETIRSVLNVSELDYS